MKTTVTIADILTAINIAATANYNVVIDSENPFDRCFVVTTPNGEQYNVDLAICRCTCKDGRTKGICSHIQYVHEVEYVFEYEAQAEAMQDGEDERAAAEFDRICRAHGI